MVTDLLQIIGMGKYLWLKEGEILSRCEGHVNLKVYNGQMSQK